MHALRKLSRTDARRRQGDPHRDSRARVCARFAQTAELWLASFSWRRSADQTDPSPADSSDSCSHGLRRYAVVATEGGSSRPFGSACGRLAAEIGENDYPYLVRGSASSLDARYLERSDITGTLDYLTEQALLAFQGWENLDRTGTVTGQTQVALVAASRPEPSARRVGRRVEIYRDRGVLLMVDNGDVVRAVHTSTGGGLTPAGSFRVYVKALLSWSVPFEVWMPYAAYFTGGIATHQSPYVPSYPASHGCVRLPEGEAERVYRFVEVGTPVVVR
jgi:hypothetical protein